MPEVLAEKSKLATANRLHGFQKGISGNPLGRPKGLKNERTLLQDALYSVESDPRTICNCQVVLGVFKTDIPRCKTVREHFIRRGLVNDQVISAVLKKLEPDLVNDMGNRNAVTINIITGKESSSLQVFRPLPSENAPIQVPA